MRLVNKTFYKCLRLHYLATRMTNFIQQYSINWENLRLRHMWYLGYVALYKYESRVNFVLITDYVLNVQLNVFCFLLTSNTTMYLLNIISLFQLVAKWPSTLEFQADVFVLFLFIEQQWIIDFITLTKISTIMGSYNN